MPSAMPAARSIEHSAGCGKRGEGADRALPLPCRERRRIRTLKKKPANPKGNGLRGENYGNNDSERITSITESQMRQQTSQFTTPTTLRALVDVISDASAFAVRKSPSAPFLRCFAPSMSLGEPGAAHAIVGNELPVMLHPSLHLPPKGEAFRGLFVHALQGGQGRLWPRSGKELAQLGLRAKAARRGPTGAFPGVGATLLEAPPAGHAGGFVRGQAAPETRAAPRPHSERLQPRQARPSPALAGPDRRPTGPEPPICTSS
jgi:hypothetical protein